MMTVEGCSPCSRFSLLPREYFSSAVPVLKKIHKIYSITKRDIFRLNFSHIDKKCDKSAALEVSAVFGTP